MFTGIKILFDVIVARGALTIIDANGTSHDFGDGSGRRVVVRLKDRSQYWKLAFNPALHLGEAYMDGDLVVEEGTVRDLLEILLSNLNRRWPRSLRILETLRILVRRLHQYNPVKRARRNVAHHYDLDGALYELFLDTDRQYSCAYFESPDASLEAAQLAKKRHLASKLMIRDRQQVLDIGSGWGGLGLYLAGLADVSVTGLTLSEEQHALSRERARVAGLGERVDFRLEDYRHVDGQFDRVISVGMFEHVGVGHYREFFDKVSDVLTDDGIAVLHSIGRFDGPGATNPWIDKYIFPGGYVPALSEVMPVIERSGLFVTDVEILRKHYAFTLEEWLARFTSRWDAASAIYDERFCRMWEFYLAGSELSFLHQDLMVFQIQMSKSLDAVPLTRDYMFEWENLRRREESDQFGPKRMAGE